ncbi:MAG: hypothetical protein K0B15_13665 [Lentimicrobium sp.]|nr:hypothetical protein [Lentimicrobium sp.]
MKGIIRITGFNLLIFCLLASGCSKSKEEEQMFEEDYDGLLTVEYINTFPDWTTSTDMEISIFRTGKVVISTGIISYSGEYVLEDGDSKITRSGNWGLAPEGRIEKGGGQTYIVIEPRINVQNDITTIYARDNSGNWVKVSEAVYNGPSGGAVTFSFEEAILSPGATETGVSDGTGEVTWTLYLLPAVTPLTP